MKASPSFDVRVGKIGEEYPTRWVEDDALGRGIPFDRYLRMLKNNEEKPHIVTFDEIEAWAVGHHMQFTAHREEVMKYLPDPTNKLMGMMKEWDNAMDHAGILQLATFERTCRHMGNVIDQSIVNDAIEMELVL